MLSIRAQVDSVDIGCDTRAMGDAERVELEEFGETLPVGEDRCPPVDASTDALEAVYRLISVEEPDETAFASFAALGEERPESLPASDCDWASCSLRTSLDALLKMKGLRRRNPYVATLSIPADSGRHTTGGTHVNFWRFAGFDIASAVVKIEKHGLS